MGFPLPIGRAGVAGELFAGDEGEVGELPLAGAGFAGLTPLLKDGIGEPPAGFAGAGRLLEVDIGLSIAVPGITLGSSLAGSAAWGVGALGKMTLASCLTGSFPGAPGIGKGKL